MKMPIRLLVVFGVFVVIGVGLWAAWYHDVFHDHVEELTHLHGKTDSEVIAILGEPDVDRRHALSSLGGEFYIEIFNTYAPDDPANEGVQIKELQWKHPRYSKAVFLHLVDGEWRVLESVRWEKGVVF